MWKGLIEERVKQLPVLMFCCSSREPRASAGLHAAAWFSYSTASGLGAHGAVTHGTGFLFLPLPLSPAG